MSEQETKPEETPKAEAEAVEEPKKEETEAAAESEKKKEDGPKEEESTATFEPVVSFLFDRLVFGYMIVFDDIVVGGECRDRCLIIRQLNGGRGGGATTLPNISLPPPSVGRDMVFVIDKFLRSLSRWYGRNLARVEGGQQRRTSLVRSPWRIYPRRGISTSFDVLSPAAAMATLRNFQRPYKNGDSQCHSRRNWYIP